MIDLKNEVSLLLEGAFFSIFAESAVPLPEVMLLPLNKTLMEGTYYNLTCIAKGNPTPKVYWQSASNNKILDEKIEGLSFQDSGFVHSLIIKSVRASDSGLIRSVFNSRIYLLFICLFITGCVNLNWS